MLIDTHCHLDFSDFDLDRDAVIERAARAGVGRIINIGSSVEGTRRSVELASKYGMAYAAIGVHPHHAETVTDALIEDFRRLARETRKVVAIGEVGLDYYRNESPKESQVAAFKKFIGLARSVDLPIIIHTREADTDITDIMRREGRGLRGVVHCFSGDERFLRECLDLGLFVSFTCNLTFKNAKALREVAKKMPVERLLLETDAPYLAPQAMRGKRNEPAHLTYLVEEWSRLIGLSKEDIGRVTTHNANALFRLGLDEPVTAVYPIRDSLYLNITNRCTNDCSFCIRTQSSFVKGHNLKLEGEPAADEIVAAVGDPKRYKEIVFCGYGEPTIRFDDVKAICRKLKEKGAAIRLVTNGHGDMINKRPIAAELSGLVDRVSVSLNAESAEKYNGLCKPHFGPEAYGKILAFIKDCVARGIETEVTCLDLPGVDIKRCEEIAAGLGARFRLRSYGIVG
ncbi:MAG: YchF/TatD family DNA exonuclease [Candidatus Omnitrophica bacterium]|nr:YchF/TatD family DNA exonuclease [Candidatus Omnitrophota bacterium]